MKDKYVIVSPYEMNSYYKEGYKFLAVLQEDYVQTDYNNPGMQINGSIGNDPISIVVNNNAIYNKYTTNSAKILMELTKQAELLYGEKREVNSGNSSNS